MSTRTATRSTTWSQVLLPLLAAVVAGVVLATALGALSASTGLDVLLVLGAVLVGWSSIATSTGAGL